MMASGGQNQQHSKTAADIETNKEKDVVRELLSILNTPNFIRYERKLSTLVRNNPWLLERAAIFCSNQAEEFHKAKSKRKLILHLYHESRENKQYLEVEKQLQNLRRDTEWLSLARRHASFMKTVIELYFRQGHDHEQKTIVAVRARLVDAIRQYEREWNDRPPILSCKIMENPETQKKEAHFSVVYFEDQRRAVLDIFQQILPVEPVGETDQIQNASHEQPRRSKLREQNRVLLKDLRKRWEVVKCKEIWQSSNMSKAEKLDKMRKLKEKEQEVAREKVRNKFRPTLKDLESEDMEFEENEKEMTVPTSSEVSYDFGQTSSESEIGHPDTESFTCPIVSSKLTLQSSETEDKQDAAVPTTSEASDDVGHMSLESDVSHSDPGILQSTQ